MRAGAGFRMELDGASTLAGERKALDRAVVERDMGDLGPSPQTAKPWFCDVTSTWPVARSSTGWFAPRWPNGSFAVEKPAARPSS